MTLQRPHFTTLFKEKELWLLILVGILYFYRPLFLDETFFFREIHSYLLPQKLFFAESIQNGQLPLWDPYIHGGLPYLTNISHSPLHPFNLLYLALPFFRAFNIIIVFHLVFSCVAAYLLARIVCLGPIPAAIAALLYGFCGYTLSATNIGHQLLVIPLLPCSLMFWHLYLLEQKSRWFMLTIGVCCIRVLSGAPEANIVGMFFLLAWALFYPYPSVRIFRRIVAWSLVGAGTLGAASVQILPALEMMLLSARGDKLGYDVFSYWSLHPQRFPELIIPNFLGYPDTLPFQAYYWGMKAEPSQQLSYIINIYIGITAILLAILGGILPTASPQFPRRIRYALLGVAIGGVTLSFGQFLPGFKLIYQYVPLIGFFRFPIKFLSISIFPMALLAGYAVDVFFSTSPTVIMRTSFRTVMYRIAGILTIISGIVVAITGSFIWSDDFAQWFQQLFFHQSSAIIREGLGKSFIHVSIILGGFTLLSISRIFIRKPWQKWLLICLIATDLLIAGVRLNPTVPTVFFTNTPPLVSLVRKEIGDGRLFRTPNSPNFTLHAPSQDIIWRYRWELETLKKFRAISFHIPIIFHYGLSLAPRRLQQLRANYLFKLPWNRRHALLSTGAVTLILTSEEIGLPGIRKIADVENLSTLPLYLYRNEKASKRLEFITQWHYVQTEEEALAALLQPTYDPRTSVVLEAPEATLFEPIPTMPESPPVVNLDSTTCASSQITIMHSTMNSKEFSVSSDCDGYLVLAEPWYPGWHMTVDGQPVGIWRANYAFSAIFLPAGDHHIERVYRPNSLFIGGALSAISCCLLALVAWKRILP